MSFWHYVDKAVGFIPVVGTIKDGVEAVVLECQGKHEAAKTKALEAAIDLATDAITVASFGSAYEVATAGKIAAEAIIKDVAEVGAKEVAEATIQQAVKHGFSKTSGKIIAGSLAGATIKEQAKASLAKKKGKKAIPSTSHPWPEKEDPNRGHHAINNGVRKVLPKIIDAFLALHSDDRYFKGLRFQELVESNFITNTMVVYRAHEQPLSQEDDQRIQSMAVYTPEGQQHNDPNEIQFGVQVAALRVSVAYYMTNLFQILLENPDKTHLLDQQKVDMIVTITAHVKEMNTNEVYVDHQALQWWLAEGNSREEYEEVRRHVAQMLNTLGRGTTNQTVTWVRELFYAYQQLNNLQVYI